MIIHESVTESDSVIIAQDGNHVYATGIIQDLEAENRNGRIYEIKEMDPELNGDRLKELISTGNLCGHAGHPSSTELSIQSVIDPKQICVRFDKVWRNGKDIHANFHGTNNELGKMFEQDLIEGVKPAFSLRALGSVDRRRDGKCYVRNIRIITWDHVIYPSHKKAYTSHIIDAKDRNKAINESAIIGINGKPLADNELHRKAMITEGTAADGFLTPIMNQQVVSYIKEESANIKTILNTFDTLYESAVLVEGGRKVALSLKGGDKIIVNLEQYVQDSIMDWCSKN
jgi:hypothetical protein